MSDATVKLATLLRLRDRAVQRLERDVAQRTEAHRAAERRHGETIAEAAAADTALDRALILRATRPCDRFAADHHAACVVALSDAEVCVNHAAQALAEAAELLAAARLAWRRAIVRRDALADQLAIARRADARATERRRTEDPVLRNAA